MHLRRKRAAFGHSRMARRLSPSACLAVLGSSAPGARISYELACGNF